jgi:hypothetical protein
LWPAHIHGRRRVTAIVPDPALPMALSMASLLCLMLLSGSAAGAGIAVGALRVRFCDALAMGTTAGRVRHRPAISEAVK